MYLSIKMKKNLVKGIIYTNRDWGSGIGDWREKKARLLSASIGLKPETDCWSMSFLLCALKTYTDSRTISETVLKKLVIYMS
jgi:hypothetical protein